MTEPTSVLTYGHLIIAVAKQLGVAYYGADGDEAAQVPVDAFLLDMCKGVVLDGLRMFSADSPPAGWRWQRPLADVDVWQSFGLAMPSTSSGGFKVTSAHADDVTTVTSTTSTFSSTDEDKVLTVQGHGAFTIDAYVSATQVTLTSGTDYSWAGTKAAAVADPTDATTATATYSEDTELTTVTADTDVFFASTEGSTMYVTDEDGGITLANYTSSVVMTVAGDVSWDGSKTFSLPSNGVYALPQTFGGEYSGPITFTAGSNYGTGIGWTSEANIRHFRENGNDTSGYPYWAAIRRNASNSRRWDLLLFPTPAGSYSVEFPYVIYFDDMLLVTEVHPAGFGHDETVKAAALAQAELNQEDAMGPRWQYYRDIALQNSYKVDARQGAKTLGYNGNPSGGQVTPGNFRQDMTRPNVTY